MPWSSSKIISAYVEETTNVVKTKKDQDIGAAS